MKILNLIKKYGTLIGFFAIIIFFTFNLPSTFLTAKNFINISQQISMLAVVAFTMTVVMVMNDFDLSVGSMASLAGIVAAVLFSMGYPIWIGILAALFVGVIGGLFNGFLVSIIGILPFVATLGTLTMFSGFAFLISGGRTIFGRDIPSEFSSFARSGMEISSLDLKIPFLSILALLILFIVWIVLEQTTYGRRLYAIGGNTEASFLAGISKLTFLFECDFTFLGRRITRRFHRISPSWHTSNKVTNRPKINPQVIFSPAQLRKSRWLNHATGKFIPFIITFNLFRSRLINFSLNTNKSKQSD